jgi:UDP-GlcNAc:undecaprenyl-phosphate GlcNAc-1-phosphate transferase
VGILDDTRGVPAVTRLVFQCGSAVILMSTGFIMTLPPIFGEYQSLVEAVVTLIWIVGVINAVNFIDGSDGLATTLSTLCMFLFVGINRILILPAEYVGDPELLFKSINLLGLAGAGCALPFLLYNISPAKCFLGDSGSTFFGLLLAVLGILTSHYNLPSTVPGSGVGFEYSFFLVPWFVLFVPIADGVRVVIGRILRGRSPWQPDNRHLHHLLHRAGLSPNQMLFLVSLGVLIFGLLGAILVRSQKSPYLLMGVVVLLVYGLFWFLKSSYRARRFVTLALNRRLLHYMDVAEGYENPASFKERFEQELARARRHGGSISVLVVNSASRKLNSPGASALENPKFLESLLCAMRREDIKSRFSNDRLAFLLIETDAELASIVSDRLRARFNSIAQGESSDLEVGIGIASFPLDGVSVTALLQSAEASALATKIAVRLFAPTARASNGASPFVRPVSNETASADKSTSRLETHDDGPIPQRGNLPPPHEKRRPRSAGAAERRWVGGK